MPRFIHSVSIQDQLISADGTYTFDLAVNPLSVVLLAIRPLNDTGTLANFPSYLALAAAMNRITIRHRGSQVFSMRGEDAAALAYFRHGIMPFQGQHDNTNNERRCCVLPLFLGRSAYDPQSCYPMSKKNELVLELDIDIADTGYDGLRLSVETIELPDAKPKEFERKISLNQTLAATGDIDVALPVGRLVRGLLLWGTTPFGGAAPAPSWGRIKVLLDNQEQGYTSTDFEVAQMLHCLWGRQPPAYDSHKHIVTTDGNAQTELATLAGPYNQGTGFEQYAFLDFDPTKDDMYSLDTKGHARFNLRPDAETADAVRVISIEVLPVSGV